MKYIFEPINLIYLKEINTWSYNGHVKSIYCKPYFDCIKKKKRLEVLMDV